ncbi:MAG TPA: glycosyltransferase [Candidatus Paceibacterota bacterium]|nr:glycosyltransferase [Candidatus Paceibacterota bacterium]
MEQTRVTAVTVVYGDRWSLLKQVAEATLSDPKTTTFVIVDNGCSDSEAMDTYAGNYPGRIVILRQPKNIGYSGAIEKGLAYARTTDCDFVFVLDDDSIPEEGAIDMFLENLKLFPDQKVVLAGNRVNVPGNSKIFRQPVLAHPVPKGTLFEVFSFKKIIALFRLLMRIPMSADRPFVPIVPMEAFVTGGTFLPIEAVREAPLPDGSLFIYGEDLEYSWRIIRLGYRAYVCARPHITDIDMTFPQEGGHIFGLFDSKFPPYKVYYRTRNAVIISRRNTIQSSPVLLLNIVIRTIGLLLIGLFSAGPTPTFAFRARIILRAVRDGYRHPWPLPSYINAPV